MDDSRAIIDLVPRFGRFMGKKELSFVPPDGNFTLMEYRVERPQGTSSIGGTGLVPITLKPSVQLTGEGGAVKVCAALLF